VGYAFAKRKEGQTGPRKKVRVGEEEKNGLPSVNKVALCQEPRAIKGHAECNVRNAMRQCVAAEGNGQLEGLSIVSLEPKA
jgi:hypothetical protein